jgi:transcriptional regulator with XRE-family HTH domain
VTPSRSGAPPSSGGAESSNGTYAARVRAARAFAGLTQDQLAERLGVDTNTIKRREAGTQHPKRGELLAIAAVTGVPESFMEHGFGEPAASEILERLGRIEAALEPSRAQGARQMEAPCVSPSP